MIEQTALEIAMWQTFALKGWSYIRVSCPDGTWAAACHPMQIGG